MIEDLYAPNQQVVRPDGSGPAEQGDGGSVVDQTPLPKDTTAATAGDDGLDAMTKDQLLAEADARGVTADASMTKDEIKAAIRAAG